jgi:hypothetical protein
MAAVFPSNPIGAIAPATLRILRRLKGLPDSYAIWQRLGPDGGPDLWVRRDDGRVWEDAEVWEQNHQVRRLNRLWLDHLALVPNPAYTDAAVLNVRKVGALTPDLGDTPNRDLLVVLAQRAELDELNRRWA